MNPSTDLVGKGKFTVIGQNNHEERIAVHNAEVEQTRLIDPLLPGSLNPFSVVNSQHQTKKRSKYSTKSKTSRKSFGCPSAAVRSGKLSPASHSVSEAKLSSLDSPHSSTASPSLTPRRASPPNNSNKKVIHRVLKVEPDEARKMMERKVTLLSCFSWDSYSSLSSSRRSERSSSTRLSASSETNRAEMKHLRDLIRRDQETLDERSARSKDAHQRNAQERERLLAKWTALRAQRKVQIKHFNKSPPDM